MSQFSYNGVILTYVKTLRFRIDDEKDPSGVDQLWRKYSLSVRGVVSGGTEITDGPASLAALQEALTTPRKALLYTLGGATIINTAGVDARYGPDAPVVEVTEVVPGVIFATVDVEVRVAACANNPGANEIASLRWSQEEDIDEGEWLTTVVTRGLLISRTDLRLLNADSFREAVPIPLPPRNFTRKSHYRLDETGTRLQFEFRDRERFKLPPLGEKVGATAAEGTFAVTSTKGGAIRFAVVNLTVRGGPATPRAQLMELAFSVAYTKLKKANPQKDDKGRIIVDYVCTEDLYRNVVQVMAKGTLAALVQGTLSQSLTSLFDGNVPGSDDTDKQKESFAPPVRLALAGLLSAAFRDPCATSYVKSQSQAGSASSASEQYPPAGFSTGQVSSISNEPASPSYKTDAGGYEHYRVEATYHWDEGLGHLPGTGVGPNPKRASFPQVHGGLMTLEIAWSYKRRGTPGVYPAYQTGDDNLKPLRAVVGPLPQLDVSGDDTPVYEATGLYVYGVKDPDKVTMVSPRPPYLSELAAQAVNLVLKYPDKTIATGGGPPASGSAVPGQPPLDSGGLGAAAAGGAAAFGTVLGSTPTGGEQPDDSLSRQLTAAENAYIDQVVQAGGDRVTVTNLVLGGLAGPLAPPGTPPVNP